MPLHDANGRKEKYRASRRPAQMPLSGSSGCPEDDHPRSARRKRAAKGDVLAKNILGSHQLPASVLVQDYPVAAVCSVNGVSMRQSIPSGDRVVREPETERRTGLSRATRWRMERAGKFPKRVKLGPNSVGWLESELEAWLSAKADARPRQAA